MREIDEQRQERVLVRGQRWSLAQAATGIAGVALSVLGILVILEAGLDGFSNPQTVDVLFTQTVWLGLVELILGVMFLASAASPRDRSLGIFTGLLTLVLGIVLIAQPNLMEGRLAGDESTAGVILLIVGLLATGTSMFAPTRERHMVAQDRDDLELHA